MREVLTASMGLASRCQVLTIPRRWLAYYKRKIALPDKLSPRFPLPARISPPETTTGQLPCRAVVLKSLNVTADACSDMASNTASIVLKPGRIVTARKREKVGDKWFVFVEGPGLPSNSALVEEEEAGEGEDPQLATLNEDTMSLMGMRAEDVGYAEALGWTFHGIHAPKRVRVESSKLDACNGEYTRGVERHAGRYIWEKTRQSRRQTRRFLYYNPLYRMWVVSKDPDSEESFDDTVSCPSYSPVGVHGWRRGARVLAESEI